MGLEAYEAVRRYESAVVAHGRRVEGHYEPVAIQPRDLELIDAVRRYKVLTTPQLVALFWPDASVQAARMRLVALFRAGFLDRFRPVADRGSFPWTYQLGPEGHRLLVSVGILPPRSRFESRQVFDYRYVLHEIEVNSWVIEWRRRLGDRLLAWEGEVQIEPPSDIQKRRIRDTDAGYDIHRLRNEWAKPVRPDAVVELATKDPLRVLTFLVEYDRTRRTDKNYDKLRRYDNFLCWWAREAMVLQQTPWVVFVCQSDEDRDRFVARAEEDMTGYIWRGSGEDRYVGRQHTLFTTAAEMYDDGVQVVGKRAPEGGVEIPVDPL